MLLSSLGEKAYSDNEDEFAIEYILSIESNNIYILTRIYIQYFNFNIYTHYIYIYILKL